MIAVFIPCSDNNSARLLITNDVPFPWVPTNAAIFLSSGIIIFFIASVSSLSIFPFISFIFLEIS